MWSLLFIVAGLITLLLMYHEIRRYTNMRLEGSVTDFERRRFGRRLLGGGLLAIVLLMTYWGYAYKESFAGHPWIFTFYWGGCLLCLFFLIILAMVDARAVLRHTIKSYMDEEGEAQRLEKFLAKNGDKVQGKTKV
jgi:hypothetical protein